MTKTTEYSQETRFPEISRNDMHNELYRLYQLDWIATHGYSVDDIIKQCNSLLSDNPDQCYGILYGHPEYGLNTAEFEETGFAGGNIYASKSEFLQNKYLEKEYIYSLIERVPEGCLAEQYRVLYDKDVSAEREEAS